MRLAIAIILLSSTMAIAQEAIPPRGWTKARVGTAGEYKTVWLEDRSWCGRRTRWWDQYRLVQVASVTCER